MNKNALFWLVFFIVLILISNAIDDSDYAVIPPLKKKELLEKGPPALPDLKPEGYGELKNPNFNDPIISIDSEAKSAHSISAGTAFSIRQDGLWVTARHVTQDCNKLVILISKTKGFRVTKVMQHPQADVSLLQTSKGAEAFNFGKGSLEYNDEGFHFGYPRGNPGDVYSRLIGRRKIHTKGARKSRENVLVWAEKIRVPDHNLSLGGISGGPILNQNGYIVGVHIAGSVRRGRSYSSLPSAVEYLLKKAELLIPAIPSENKVIEKLNSNDFSKAGQFLRKRLSVAKVVCIVK